ncbi:MAG: SDR family NAD(P)-dependent oxidoreductase [Alphaproteobacteria bacterium]|nr:SDR family NAD(P)-dependent oxidoreductase [Alphaproteobacteria bacterium]
MLLEGKTIYMTGGSGGLGQPLANLLSQAGAELTQHDRKKDGDLAGDIAPLCRRLGKEPPDILINLAGINRLGWCETQDPEAMLRVNLHAPIRLAQAVLPGMKARGSGQIVNIGSMTGLVPLPYYSVYVASKAGLKGFNDSLRRELYGTGIALTHIAPRAVQTSMNEGDIAEFNRRTHIYVDKADKIAARILRAIERKEKDVRIGLPENFFAFMSFAFPGVVDKGLEDYRKAGRAIFTEQNPKEERHEKELAA